MKAPRGADGNPTFGFLPSPPPLPRIAARALVFCALAQRVEIEPPPGAAIDAATLESMQELLALSVDWLGRNGMDAELTAAERAALQQPVGRLAAAAHERHAHSGEAACVLAWALRRAPLPAFDADADAAAVAAALGWLGEHGATLGSSARLRPREQVGAYLDAVSAVHWRLREQSRPASGAGDAAVAISMARWQPARHPWPEDVTPLELATGDDLALGGRPVGAATALELLAALQRIRERHRAALWLLGQQRDYDDVEFNL